MKAFTVTLTALLLIGSAATAVAAPGGTGVGVNGTGPRATSPSFTAPTNPNTRSGNAFGHPGAPSVSCQSIGVTPGNAANSPGAPFNEPTATNAGGNAGLHYAGNVPQSQKNTASVAQYDVACANAAAHGH